MWGIEPPLELPCTMEAILSIARSIESPISSNRPRKDITRSSSSQLNWYPCCSGIEPLFHTFRNERWPSHSVPKSFVLSLRRTALHICNCVVGNGAGTWGLTSASGRIADPAGSLVHSTCVSAQVIPDNFISSYIRTRTTHRWLCRWWHLLWGSPTKVD